jgi:hypothetical protein
MTAGYTQRDTPEANRIPDHDLLEPSPSTDWRETAVAMHAPRAHAVEPVDEQTPPPERPADERAPADPEVTVFS